jgi:hypothetical protein
LFKAGQLPHLETGFFAPASAGFRFAGMFFLSEKSRKTFPAGFLREKKRADTCWRVFHGGKSSPPAAGRFFTREKVCRHMPEGFLREIKLPGTCWRVFYAEKKSLTAVGGFFFP